MTYTKEVKHNGSGEFQTYGVRSIDGEFGIKDCQPYEANNREEVLARVQEQYPDTELRSAVQYHETKEAQEGAWVTARLKAD